MKRKDFQLAGFTDAEGRLRPQIGGVSDILVPPSAEVREVSYYGGAAVQSIVYPVPPAWGKRLPISPIGAARGPSLIEAAGWRGRSSATGLLEDFIALATGSPEGVRDFVLRWGPLWVCARHTENGFDCHWRLPNFDVDPPVEADSICEWFGSEPVDLFLSRAREASAAFEMAHLLMEGKTASEAHMRELGMHSRPAKVDGQRRLLARRITDKLTIAGGPTLRLIWDGEERPRLEFRTGLGFFRLAWLQIAQAISRATGLYVCSGCGEAYVREKKKPAEGKANYCDNCGKKASNRESARRRRKAKAVAAS